MYSTLQHQWGTGVAYWQKYFLMVGGVVAGAHKKSGSTNILFLFLSFTPINPMKPVSQKRHQKLYGRLQLGDIKEAIVDQYVDKVLFLKISELNHFVEIEQHHLD